MWSILWMSVYTIMLAKLLGQFSTSDVKKLPLILREGAMEFEECNVVSVAIIGVMKDYDNFTVSSFFFNFERNLMLIRALVG